MPRILLALALACSVEGSLRKTTLKLAEDPPADPQPTPAGIGYDLDAFKEEWRGEWKHEWSGDIPKSPKWKKGDTIENGHTIPGWKVTNTHANGHFADEYLPWEDKQSDSKKSETKSWYTLMQENARSQRLKKVAEEPA